MKRKSGFKKRWPATLVLSMVMTGIAQAAAPSPEILAYVCRSVIAAKLLGLAAVGLSSADVCHILRNKAPGASTAPCNDVNDPLYDPADKVPLIESKIVPVVNPASAISRCKTGNLALANYPGPDPTPSLFAALDSIIQGNTQTLVGSMNLGGDPYKGKCSIGIIKARTLIVDVLAKYAFKCQLLKDKAASKIPGSMFGAIDPSCLTLATMDPGGIITGKAQTIITKSCNFILKTGPLHLSGTDVGACNPLPGCVTDGATAAAQTLAKAFYQTLPPNLCGNGNLDPGEQCDDHNLNDGDGCNHLCESEASTCSPKIGTRTVKVNITTPEPLAGVQVGLDYPQLETSIPGHGGSTVVQSAVAIMQSGGFSSVNDTDVDFSIALGGVTPFITTGELFEIAFDNCTAASHNVCNRSQNVIDCCTTTDIAACAADPTNFAVCGCHLGTATSAADCKSNQFPFEVCSSGVCAGSPTFPVALDAATCNACPFLSFGGKCFSVANPPKCNPGQFPPSAIGSCASAGGPADGCPGDNVCESQTQLTACTVSNPVDQNGEHVDGVSCSVEITE